MIQEIRILREISHPNVIKIHEVYETKKYVHLVLTYLSGGELFKRISTKGLYKESDAKPIMKHFMTGLEHLHSQLIMHRDLKPENLIFADSKDDAVLKIADFGLGI